MKQKRAIDKLIDQEPIEVPWEVWTFFCEHQCDLHIHGDEISLNSDYKSLKEVRVAVEWFAKQFGGTVKWSKHESKKI